MKDKITSPNRLAVLRASRRGKAGQTTLDLILYTALASLALLALVAGGLWARNVINENRSVTQIRKVQQAMRALAADKNIAVGGACTKAMLVGSGLAFENEPVDMANGNAAYTWGTTVPAYGTAFLSSANANVTSKASPVE